MIRELTAKETITVDSRRKNQKPSVYNPNGTVATVITDDFEAWLILAGNTAKSTLVSWINDLLTSEADKVYQDLLKETSDKEGTSIGLQRSDLSPQTTSFTTWRESAGVKGWEDVTEIGWLMQEVQAGLDPFAEDAELEHLDALRRHAHNRRQISEDSEASREQRLRAWVAALNSY